MNQKKLPFDKILVISLERATERRSNVVSKFADHGIGIELIDAVDGLNIDANHMYSDGRVRHMPFMKRRLTRGEIACVQSHRLAWERVVDSYDRVLICEDDIVFRPDSIEMLHHVMYYAPPNWDILYLWSYLSPARKRYNMDWEIARFEYGGAMCYAITMRVAMYLRAISNPIDNVLDKITARVTQDGSQFCGYICHNVFDHDNSAHSYIAELGR